MCWHFCFLPPRIPSAHKCEVSHTKRPRLLSQLALPYSRFSFRRSQSGQKSRQVVLKPNGVESEPSSHFSADATSDLSEVMSRIPDVGSEPPSPRVLKNIEQGSLGAVVREEQGMLGSILVSCVLFLFPFSQSSFQKWLESSTILLNFPQAQIHENLDAPPQKRCSQSLSFLRVCFSIPHHQSTSE